MQDGTQATKTVLRHIIATLTYRAAKVPRDVPPGFGMTFASSTRKPVLIVAHLADLMGWPSA